MDNYIPISEPSITHREIEYVIDAVKSGWVSSLGKYIEIFEQKFAKYVGSKYALAVSNGTTALHLALASLGIKKGDEVIVPDLTFVATANVVVYTGARPIFADIDPQTWCIDPEDVKTKITPKTKAIIPVHLYGHPADMDTINDIAEENALYVIEDAAEAHGAEYKGKRVGSIGTCGIFSFYGNKIITTGEGGMLTTDEESLYKRAKFLKDHAMSAEKRYWHPEVGYNYRMTNIQAALGLAQLERIEQIIEKKKLVFEWYKECLNIGGIVLNPQKRWAKNVYWMVCILVNDNVGVSRDELMKRLRQRGIDTRPFFYPMSELPMYGGKPLNPVAKYISKSGINLPSSSNLSREDVSYIYEEIKQAIQK